jgi:hypothetical protein
MASIRSLSEGLAICFKQRLSRRIAALAIAMRMSAGCANIAHPAMNNSGLAGSKLQTGTNLGQDFGAKAFDATKIVE